MAHTIGGTTQVVAVIGDPIAHTKSPAMHNAAFRALGLDWVYIACHVRPECVGEAVAAIRALEWRGMNVTVPHKQAVMPFLDEISDAARAVGAVNTIANLDGRLVGENTDVAGIIRAITDGAGLTAWPDRAVVLGAGGAARGVVHALANVARVRRVTILNRTPERAAALAAEFDAGRGRIDAGPLDIAYAREAIRGSGLLLNVTNVGRGELAGTSPIADEWDCLHGDLVCVDANYSPPETALMRQVRAAGGRAYNGIDMLVYQGARSFEIWTGQAPPIDVMRRAATG